MSNITAPVLAIKTRLHFHAETGYVPSGQVDVLKILDGLKIYDDPAARNQENEDLPNVMIDLPSMIGDIEPGHAQIAYGDCDQVLELSVARENGQIGTEGKSLMEWVSKIVAALTRDETGGIDHYLGKTVPKQIVISATDGIASELSLTIAITIKWRTKAYS